MAGPPSTPAGTINLTIRKRATSFTPTPEWLAERGYADVTEVESAQEHLLFALPPELRRDLRKAGIAES